MCWWSHKTLIKKLAKIQKRFYSLVWVSIWRIHRPEQILAEPLSGMKDLKFDIKI